MPGSVSQDPAFHRIGGTEVTSPSYRRCLSCPPIPSALLLRVRPLRYSINVTLDGCCNHGAIIPSEDLHRHAVENLNWADALLFGRLICRNDGGGSVAAARPGGSDA